MLANILLYDSDMYEKDTNKEIIKTEIIYRISTNKRPRRLLNFETVMWGAYWRAALVRGRRLFQN